MHIDEGRIDQVAAIIAALPEGDAAFNFHGHVVGGTEVHIADMYPPIGHESAIEYFFFVCLHQHGFWYGSQDGYLQPLYGYVDGKQCKGSDLLEKLCMRALIRDPRVFSPKKLSVMSNDAFDALFSDDNGPVTFPDKRERLTLTRSYGRRMQENIQTPAGLVAAANASPTGQVLADFLASMQGSPGFGEKLPEIPGVTGFGDRFRKKALLLAMALSSRPEKFLKVSDPEHWKPIVDYHVMRLALRTGMVTLDEPRAAANTERRWVNAETEMRIRGLTYLAVDRVMRRSKRSLAVIDHAFWSARKFCPETETPDCDTCTFAAACAKRTELFQPVYRTMDY